MYLFFIIVNFVKKTAKTITKTTFFDFIDLIEIVR